METKANLKHARDDFKQWRKYHTNPLKWYLQWKKCFNHEDLLFTWTTVHVLR